MNAEKLKTAGKPAGTQWSVRGRVLVLSIVPLLIITCVLTGYLVISRQQDSRELFIKSGTTISHYLASVSEFGLFAADKDGLQQYANAALQEPEVVSVNFYDQDQQPILQVGAAVSFPPVKFSQVLELAEHGGYQLFRQPVFYSPLEIDDASERGDNAARQLLGWTQVIIDEQDLLRRQQEILLAGISIASVGLALMIFLAVRFSRTISEPIFDLAATVSLIGSGALEARASEVPGIELSVLARGINQMAEQVSRSSQELQGRVDEATRQLQQTLQSLEGRNKDLVKAQVELESASQAKDEFLARMSHELRTPLTSVIGYCGLLDKSAISESQREYTHIMLQSSTFLLSIIDDLLDISKLQSDAISLVEETFDLHGCLDDVVEMHAQRAHERNLEMVLLIEPDVPRWIRGDSQRLKQIVSNLVSNAVKFTLRGEVVVGVILKEETQSSVRLAFEIRDTGIGIKAADQQKLFTEFRQADESITRQFGGSGLGLSIVRRLTQLMGGDVELESEPGVGTRVTCELRFSRDGRQPSPAFGITDCRDHIVICEGHPLTLRVLRNICYRRSRKITALGDRQALDLLLAEENEIRLLILGLAPDQLDADLLFASLLNIRAGYRGPLLLLASADRLPLCDDELRWESLQPVEFLSKPLRPKRLLDRIRRFGGGDQDLSEASQRASMANLDDGALAIPEIPRKLRIMVAEDNQFIRRFVVELLAGVEAEIVEAGTGAEAIVLAQTESLDVAFIDLHMPETDGLEAARVMRELHEPGVGPCLLALTAAAGSDPKLVVAESLFDAILHKPIDEPLFWRTLAALVNSKENGAGKPGFLSGPSDVAPRPSFIKFERDEGKQEARRLLAALERAAADNDPAQIVAWAHQLRGVAGCLEGGKEAADFLALFEDSQALGPKAAGDERWALQPWLQQLRQLLRELLE